MSRIRNTDFKTRFKKTPLISLDQSTYRYKLNVKMLTCESESLLNLSMAQRDWMGSIIFSLELQASANLQACGCYNEK
jgi:hypothetical protein